MANETFTLTLDDQGNSVNVTVVDTSQDPPEGNQIFSDVGTHTWTVPSGITEISAVAIGGGGGGFGHWDVDANYLQSARSGNGGDLSYVNSLSVTPGEELTVVVGAEGQGHSYTAGRFSGPGNQATPGGSSYIQRGTTFLLCARGGSAGSSVSESNVGDVTYLGGSGANKGGSQNGGPGGGGAAGYAQNGGNGRPGGFSIYNEPGTTNVITGGSATGGNGAFGQSSNGSGGGGVGIEGQGNNPPKQSGRGGSGGSNASGAHGGAYGGGGGGGKTSGGGTGDGGQGAVNIYWGGADFPVPGLGGGTVTVDSKGSLAIKS